MILPFFAELLLRVARHAEVDAALAALDEARRRGGEVRLSGLNDTAKALLIALLARRRPGLRPVMVLVESNRRAEALLPAVRFFHQALGPVYPEAASGGRRAAERGPAAMLPAVALLPGFDRMPGQGLAPHAEILAARAQALWQLSAGEAGVMLVAESAARLGYAGGEGYRALARALERGAEAPLEELLAFLRRTGYERHEMVELPGQFAVRGGLVDVFPPQAERPVRLELFGDTLESLREFDPATQRSVRPLERALLLPLCESPPGEEPFSAQPAPAGPGTEPAAGSGSLFDLVEESGSAGADAPVCPQDAAGRPAAGRAVWVVDEPDSLTDPAVRAALAGRPRLLLEQLPLEDSAPGAPRYTLLTRPTLRFHGNVGAFFAEVRGRLSEGEQVVVCAASTGEMERLAGLCHEHGTAYRLGEVRQGATMARLAEESAAGSVAAVVLVTAPLAEGVAFPGLRLTLHGNADLFEAAAPRPRPGGLGARRAAGHAAAFASDLADLKPGDYVVHVDHGIGQFEGLREIATDGASGEFLELRYADDARLYVPLARLDLVQKYRSLALSEAAAPGESAAPPALDRLGGTAWAARKKRVRKSLADLAGHLLRLYAQRRTEPGYAFSPDSEWQREFEDAFEFEETPDQARAIAEVKADMERPAPMDRLLCGDVGYGKTEVALRAAFKAVSDSRQVALLAPTTVLAFQHYETFRRRLAAFPIRVEMLSRFRSAREQKRILGEVEAGKVDIVIGTHRLLSRDVRFHDLGLLIVDEEQRFGVAHKERLKELPRGANGRRNVDVLTLSATPIPRTLHMSLAGLRDMSVMETPPRDRLAIHTVVTPFRDTLVQKAIEEELARGGQVFFVHNRVQSIHSLAALVARLVPRARLAVAHGQMAEKDLERVMLRFLRREADVLVSTSIIENGLDIPTANTILINRADRFGLAELYQLRGRVGRSHQRAYAYLLVPPEGALSPLARRRLAALAEFSELGAGFRIAALDLELRGAGHLLGRQQHGHIHAVGFDLYCRMLERAVAERRGQAAPPERRVTLNLGQDLRIPPGYIPSENLRLRTYKRIAEVASAEEREEVLAELADRFGPPPPAVLRLLDYAALKAACERLLVAAVERKGERVAVRFYDDTPVQPAEVVRLLRSSPGARLDPSGVLWLELPPGEEAGAAARVQKVLLQLEAKR